MPRSMISRMSRRFGFRLVLAHLRQPLEIQAIQEFMMRARSGSCAAVDHGRIHGRRAGSFIRSLTRLPSLSRRH
jgi:hypothetical protein